jgi:hypothetical protein
MVIYSFHSMAFTQHETPGPGTLAQSQTVMIRLTQQVMHKRAGGLHSIVSMKTIRVRSPLGDYSFITPRGSRGRRDGKKEGHDSGLQARRQSHESLGTASYPIEGCRDFAESPREPWAKSKTTTAASSLVWEMRCG